MAFSRFLGLGVATLELLSLSVTRPASADVTIGGTNGNNSYPFGNTNSVVGYLGEYQQIYSRAAFDGSVLINSVAFSISNQSFSSGVLTDTFTLGLSNTSQSVVAPSTNYAANKGANFTTVYSGTTSFVAATNNTFDYVITLTTPFTYDPAQGNLLLDVNLSSNSSTVPGGVTFQAGDSTQTGRVYNINGKGAAVSNSNYGLLTRFGTTPTPAPPGLISLLLGGGVTLFGTWRRHNRSKADKGDRGILSPL